MGKVISGIHMVISKPVQGVMVQKKKIEQQLVQNAMAAEKRKYHAEPVMAKDRYGWMIDCGIDY